MSSRQKASPLYSSPKQEEEAQATTTMDRVQLTAHAIRTNPHFGDFYARLGDYLAGPSPSFPSPEQRAERRATLHDGRSLSRREAYLACLALDPHNRRALRGLAETLPPSSPSAPLCSSFPAPLEGPQASF